MDILNMWTLYNTETRDYPGKFVARRFQISTPIKGEPAISEPTSDHFAHESVGTVEVWVRQNAAKFGNFKPHKLGRDPFDDPCIIGTFI